MVKNNVVETLVGAAVVLVALFFFYFAYSTTNIVGGAENGYNMVAKFDRVDGLNPGGDVKIGGVKVGKVTSMVLDEKNYQAVITVRIKEGVTIPVDSTAEIIGNGLLGEKYIAIIPGSESDHIADNGVIEFTQSSISLESLIGKFMFGSANKSEGSEGAKTESGQKSPKKINR